MFDTYTVQCINNQQPCFYQLQSTINQPIALYYFCNYTLSSCLACYNGLSCNSCQNGFYTFTFDYVNSLQNCQPCNQSIQGCNYCSNQMQCTQCQLPYLKKNGVCFYLNSTQVGGYTPWTGGGSTAA